MKKQIFMTTVSTLALTSASVGMVTAQDGAPKADPKFTLTLEGSFGHLDTAPKDKWGAQTAPGSGFSDKAGADQDLAYMGAISLSRSIGENRDVRFGLGFGGNPSNVDLNTSTYTDGEYFLGAGMATTSIGNDFGFTNVDIDASQGKATAFGDLTAFGGLRGLVTSSVSNSSTDKIGTDEGVGYYTANTEMRVYSNFVGLGPRLGVGFESKHFAGGFGVSSEVAGSVVYGQRSDNGTIDHVGSSEFGDNLTPDQYASESTTESQIIKTLDAKASVDYHFSENATLSLGYQARQFWNVDIFSDEENDTAKSRLVDGAFIAFTTKF